MKPGSPRFGAKKLEPPKPAVAEVRSAAIVEAMMPLVNSSRESEMLLRELINKMPEQQGRITGLKIVTEMDKKHVRYGMMKEVLFIRG